MSLKSAEIVWQLGEQAHLFPVRSFFFYFFARKELLMCCVQCGSWDISQHPTYKAMEVHWDLHCFNCNLWWTEVAEIVEEVVVEEVVEEVEVIEEGWWRRLWRR